MTRYLARSALNAACAAATLALPVTGSASGFAVPEISIAGLGLSNAVVANTDEVGAIAYNPALAAFHDGMTVSGGLMVVRPTLEVSTSTGDHESAGKDNAFIPMFQLTYAVNDRVTLGIGANAPFGLETKWEDGTFPILAAFDPDGTPPNGSPTGGFIAPGGLQPTTSRLETVVVSPTVTYRLNEQAAVSAGADYYYVKEVVFNSAAAITEGDGDGWGWNVSAVYTEGALTFGAAYHSKAEVGVTGDSEVILTGGPPSPTARASADVPLPWRLQAGVHYQVNDALGVEFDITRTGWSEFDELTIDGVSTITSTNNWDDANAYRLGVSYQMSPRTRLRFGYTYDETGQDDDFYSARIPDADRHLFSVGVGHELENGFTVDAGYMYVRFKDRDYSTSVPFGTYGSDPNGTNAYNGDYSAHVHLFGVGVSKAF